MSDPHNPRTAPTPQQGAFPPPPAPAPAGARERPVPLMAMVVALVALLVGGVGGFVIGGKAGDDVSASGQLAYACALAEKVREDHRTEEDWGPLGEERAYNEVAAIGGLLGGFVPQEEDPLSETGSRLFTGLARVQFDELNAALDETVRECSDR